MKKALLSVTLSLFCITSISWLLSGMPDFPVESTTPFEITMGGSKGSAVLNYYMPIFKINKFRSLSPGFSIVIMISQQGAGAFAKGERLT